MASVCNRNKVKQTARWHMNTTQDECQRRTFNNHLKETLGLIRQRNNNNSRRHQNNVPAICAVFFQSAITHRSS